MMKIEAVIQTSRFEDVREALRGLEIARMFVSEVASHGGPWAQTLFYRGSQYQAGAPMTKLELLVPAACVDEVVESISRHARTNLQVDDGSITISRLDDAISIRNGSRVEFATL